ncbi:MAG: Hint domain-containing homing endonuclease, partial [Candidatus Woesearchaeota archaeon]
YRTDRGGGSCTGSWANRLYSNMLPLNSGLVIDNDKWGWIYEEVWQNPVECAVKQLAENYVDALNNCPSAASCIISWHGLRAYRAYTGGGTWGSCHFEAIWSCSCSSGFFVTCFVKGTKIKMADGSLKNIEDIQIGEKVMGSSGINTVIGLERPIIGNRVTYVLNDIVEFTGDHPFMAEDGTWRVADLDLWHAFPRSLNTEPLQLKIGDRLISEEGVVEVKSLTKKNSRPYSETVYDLKLDGDHTYIANGLVVHNCW